MDWATFWAIIKKRIWSPCFCAFLGYIFFFFLPLRKTNTQRVFVLFLLHSLPFDPMSIKFKFCSSLVRVGCFIKKDGKSAFSKKKLYSIMYMFHWY
jgi:hypothetical protein